DRSPVLEWRRFVPRIVPYPHPALRYVSRPLVRIDEELHATVRSMFDLMYEARGIGLAANQVGLPFRFFVLNLTADPEQRAQAEGRYPGDAELLRRLDAMTGPSLDLAQPEPVPDVAPPPPPAPDPAAGVAAGHPAAG